jgi:hypothetical protein
MQHLENKYSRTYFQIIERNIRAKHNGYIERHHIIPRSLGGQDKNDNLVDLTAREHFICHWLLTKMFPVDSDEYKKMCLAFGMMLWARSDSHQRNYAINSKTYERLRQQLSAFMSEFQSGKYNSQYGKMWICNLDLQQNKKISKSESIPDGWAKGRVVNWEKHKKEIDSGKVLVFSEKTNYYVNAIKEKKSIRKPVLEKRNCENCGKEFEVLETRKKLFCSRSCKNAAKFKNVKMITIERDGVQKEIKPQNFNSYKKIGWKKV